MKYRQFGTAEFKVSALGLGCMRLPVKRFIPMKVDVPKAVKLIRSAVDNGVNYLDTAWPYHFGESEKVVGIALGDGYRERVHLATKLPLFVVSKQGDFDRFLNSQLQKLKTDYIDTYLFHAVTRSGLEKIKRLNLLNKMMDAKKDGRIKYIGFSFHDTLPVFKEIIDLFNWDVAQIQYNYMDTGIQATTEGLKYAASKGVAVVIMEPLKGGTLADPPKEAVAVMNQSPAGRSSVDWALQYLWNLPEVSVVLSGMGNLKMLNENLRSAENSGIDSLSGDDLKIISNLVGIYREKIVVPCTSCKYCLPCPSGVNIPQNFAILNNVAMAERKIFNWGIKASYRKLASTPSRLNKGKSNGASSLCTACGLCVPKCPQTIDIPVELKKVTDALGRLRQPGKLLLVK